MQASPILLPVLLLEPMLGPSDIREATIESCLRDERPSEARTAATQ